jgi:hypothetical protein
MEIDRQVIVEVLKENYNAELSSAMIREKIADDIYKKLTGSDIDGQVEPVDRDDVTLGTFEKQMREKENISADTLEFEHTPTSKKTTKKQTKPIKKKKKMFDKKDVRL